MHGVVTPGRQRAEGPESKGPLRGREQTVDLADEAIRPDGLQTDVLIVASRSLEVVARRDHGARGLERRWHRRIGQADGRSKRQRRSLLKSVSKARRQLRIAPQQL